MYILNQNRCILFIVYYLFFSFSLQLQWTCTSMPLQFGTLQALWSRIGWSVWELSTRYNWTILSLLQRGLLSWSSKTHHPQKSLQTWVKLRIYRFKVSMKWEFRHALKLQSHHRTEISCDATVMQFFRPSLLMSYANIFTFFCSVW